MVDFTAPRTGQFDLSLNNYEYKGLSVIDFKTILTFPKIKLLVL